MNLLSKKEITASSLLIVNSNFPCISTRKEALLMNFEYLDKENLNAKDDELINHP